MVSRCCGRPSLYGDYDAEVHILVYAECGQTFPIEDREELETCIECGEGPCVAGLDVCQECLMN